MARSLFRSFRYFAVLAALVMAGCGSGAGPTEGDAMAQEPAAAAESGTQALAVTEPFAMALGSVQDGGLPHAGCSCDRCELARQDPAHRRLVASLALVLPHPAGETPQVYLIDASPDVAEQLHLLRPYRDWPRGRVDRTPLAGVFLTHAHMGHYLGLAQFGFEVMHAQGVEAYCTPRMASFLRENGPWSQLVDKGELVLVETPPGRPTELGAGVSVTPVRVPHRDEFSDTVGYLVRGPNRTLFYVPDTDSWRAWDRPVAEFLEAVGADVFLPDGTFYSQAELPGRDISSIGHPLITETIEALEEAVDEGRLEVWFTHLNHSNPALDPNSPERARIEKAGFAVVSEGQRFAL